MNIKVNAIMIPTLALATSAGCKTVTIIPSTSDWGAQAYQEQDTMSMLMSRMATSAADINSVPIVYWYSRSANGHVEQFALVGHAESMCCAEVSHAVTLAGNTSDIDAWMTYGVSTFTCDPRQGCRSDAVLDELVDTLVASQSTTCAEQMLGYEVEREAFMSPREDIEASVVTACRQASSEDRVIGYWHEMDGPPVTMPLLDARGRPVVIQVPRSVFDVPDALSDEVTIDGIDRASASLQQRVSALEAIVKHGSAVGPDRATMGDKYGIEEHADGDVTETYLQAQIAAAEEGVRWISNALMLIEAIVSLEDEEYRLRGGSEDKKYELARMAEFEDSIAINRKALERLRAGEHVSRYMEVDVYTKANELLVLVEAAEAALPAARKDLETVLGMPQQVARQGEAIMIDAYLRGWTATFAAEDLHQQYEAWARRPGIQEGAWAAIDDIFKDVYDFDHARERLLLSNIYFEVEARGEAILIAPHYVLGSDFLVICEPGESVARLESVSADQNLMPLE